MTKRANKFNAMPTTVDGIRFASRREAKRYSQLKLLERAGTISNLELQPRYNINVNGEYIGFYKADFRYFEDGCRVVEDTKGMKTPLYRWKKKLVEVLFPGVKIVEV